jgi:DNA repair exonuclease SbcCD ATPase subunit
MDEISREIADLKADLLDAQKENERLEKELQESYDDSKPKVQAPVLTDLNKKIQELELRASQTESNLRLAEQESQRARSATRKMGVDLMKALAVVEVIRMNEKDAWQYFQTPEGQSLMKWASARYNQEANSFMHILGREE